MVNKLYVGTVILLMSLMLFSCIDDEEFTTNWNSVLTFETDSVKFDTVFSTIGSETHRVRVFNRGSKGLRLTSVALESGGTSGFRINVDGHSGAIVTDLEVPHNDSIFVFVDVIPAYRDMDEPVELVDRLIFTLESGRQQSMVLCATGQDVIILSTEVIDADRTLSSPRPYVIYDSLVVAQGATLTLDAGVKLCFHDGAYLGVHGRLVSNGSADKMVVMRTDRTGRMFQNLPFDWIAGYWEGVRIYPESSLNTLQFTDIHGGNYGIDCQMSDLVDEKLYLYNCRIHNVNGNGLYLGACKSRVLGTQITNAGKHCVQLVGGNADFVHCTIAQFFPWGAWRQEALNIANYEADKDVPLYAANFANCIITGWSNDEISISDIAHEGIDFEFSFVSSLINIKMTGNESDNIISRFVNCINENDLDGDDAIKGLDNFFHEIDYFYDFHLQESSPACGLGADEYAPLCPIDLDGVSRPTEHPDAGCYVKLNNTEKMMDEE